MKFLNSSFPLKNYIFSFILAFLITTVLMGIVSIIFSFFPPPAWLFNITGLWGYLSSFIAAFICGAKTHKNGLLTGIICADMYIFILLVFGMLIFKTPFPVAEAFKIFSLNTFIGAIGGIAGVNFKK